MNILFWILQIILALHTIAGAIWKFSNSAQTVPSLQSIPHGVWMAMSVIELLCGIGLILPAINKRLGATAVASAAFVAAEMLLLCIVSAFSGNMNAGHIIYWLVVAAFSLFVVYGRSSLKPFKTL